MKPTICHKSYMVLLDNNSNIILMSFSIIKFKANKHFTVAFCHLLWLYLPWRSWTFVGVHTIVVRGLRFFVQHISTSGCCRGYALKQATNVKITNTSVTMSKCNMKRNTGLTWVKSKIWSLLDGVNFLQRQKWRY